MKPTKIWIFPWMFVSDSWLRSWPKITWFTLVIHLDHPKKLGFYVIVSRTTGIYYDFYDLILEKQKVPEDSTNPNLDHLTISQETGFFPYFWIQKEVRVPQKITAMMDKTKTVYVSWWYFLMIFTQYSPISYLCFSFRVWLRMTMEENASKTRVNIHTRGCLPGYSSQECGIILAFDPSPYPIHHDPLPPTVTLRTRKGSPKATIDPI